MTQIPTPATVTPAWLTERLRSAGYDAEVVGFRASRIGTGQMGLCVRYELEFAAGSADDGAAPRTLVGKFPSDDPTSRATGVQLRNYLKEVSFYRDLQGRLDISTPRCFYAEIEGEGPNFALLLEDLAPARQGDQLTGCTADVARAAVLELVGLHAPSWNTPAFRGVEWIGEPDEAGRENMRQLYGSLLPGFLARYGARLAPDQIEIIAAVAEAPAGPLFSELGDPYALVHVDYRLDNLLIDQRRSPPGIAVVDWQTSNYLGTGMDVAYFLGGAFDRDTRRAVERDLLREYHADLLARGVPDYDFEHLMRDYRHYSFAVLVVAIAATIIVKPTERGDRLFMKMVTDGAYQAIDNDAADLLPN